MPASAPPLPHCLLPELFDLQRLPPSEPMAFLEAALDPAAAPAPGSVAAAEVLRFAAKHGLGAQSLEAALRAAGLGEALSKMFADYLAGQPSIGALLKTASSGPPLTLVDVDWTFGVSASSSEHQAMGTTFVQLRLHVLGADGAARYVHAELDLAQFYALLHELEQAKARMEYGV